MEEMDTMPFGFFNLFLLQQQLPLYPVQWLNEHNLFPTWFTLWLSLDLFIQ